MTSITEKNGGILVPKGATFHRLERDVLMMHELMSYILGRHKVGYDAWVSVAEPGFDLLGMFFEVVGDLGGDNHTCSERMVLRINQHEMVI